MYVLGVHIRQLDLILFLCGQLFSSIDKTDTQVEEKQKTNKNPTTMSTNVLYGKLFLFFCWGATCEVIDLSYVFNDVYSIVQCSTQ